MPIGKKLLVVTGDFRNFSDHTYHQAESFLEELYRAMDIDPERDVFVVPGNHDVDWESALDSDSSSRKYPADSTCRSKALSVPCTPPVRDTPVCGRNRCLLPPVEEIEEIVKPCGLGHSKARDISACMIHPASGYSFFSRSMISKASSFFVFSSFEHFSFARLSFNNFGRAG